jgi:pyroglutamyl-peptidase
MLKVLVAGFGPFPGAPRNPSGDLALALGRMRRPGLASVKIHSHVFPTIYAAVAKELPRLLAKFDPDAVLLFGLAGRSDRVRIETRAVNAASLIYPDAARHTPSSQKLFPQAPAELFVRPEIRRLIAAARSGGVPARLSRDAGRYVCNASLFACLDKTRRKHRPLVTFIHIPWPRARNARQRNGNQPSAMALFRTGEAILRALVAEARRK